MSAPTTRASITIRERGEEAFTRRCSGSYVLSSPQGPRGSVDPAVFNRLTVGLAMGAKDDELETLGARLEGPRHLGRDAKGVQRADIDDLIVELGPPRPAEDHVDLLRPLVAMHKGRALSGPKAEVSQSGLLGVE